MTATNTAVPSTKPITVRTVLCGTDLSDNARRALGAAAELAQMYGAKLVVAHVIQTWDERYDFLVQDLTEKLTEEARTQLGAELARLGQTKTVPVEVVIKKGEPLECLLDAVRETQADLVVLGRKGVTNDDDEELGCLPDCMLQASPVSVLVVHPDHPRDIKSIVCPMDFTECSVLGLNWAVDLARRERIASIAVINTYQVPRGYIEAGMTYETACERMRRLHQEDADKVLAPYAAGSVKIEVDLVEGPTAPTITRAAKERHSDLVVLGTHERSQFTAFLVGGTAKRILRNASVSVLVAKSKEHHLSLLAALGRI